MPEGVLEHIREKGIQLIEPKVSSRRVKIKDLFRVLKQSSRVKMAMLRIFPGKYPLAASIAHCQWEPNDPLRFFVLERKFGAHFGNKLFKVRTVINPKIKDTGKYFNSHKEGCMSFPHRSAKKIKRHQIVYVEYWTFFGKKTRKLYEFPAAMMQHEIDHFNNVNIYDRYYKKK